MQLEGMTTIDALQVRAVAQLQFEWCCLRVHLHNAAIQCTGAARHAGPVQLQRLARCLAADQVGGGADGRAAAPRELVRPKRHDCICAHAGCEERRINANRVPNIAC